MSEKECFTSHLHQQWCRYWYWQKLSVADCTIRFSVLGAIRATAVVKDTWNNVEKDDWQDPQHF